MSRSDDERKDRSGSGRDENEPGFEVIDSDDIDNIDVEQRYDEVRGQKINGWICDRCYYKNFNKRKTCKSCQLSKTGNERQTYIDKTHQIAADLNNPHNRNFGRDRPFSEADYYSRRDDRPNNRQNFGPLRRPSPRRPSPRRPSPRRPSPRRSSPRSRSPRRSRHSSRQSSRRRGHDDRSRSRSWSPRRSRHSSRQSSRRRGYDDRSESRNGRRRYAASEPARDSRYDFHDRRRENDRGRRQQSNDAAYRDSYTPPRSRHDGPPLPVQSIQPAPQEIALSRFHERVQRELMFENAMKSHAEAQVAASSDVDQRMRRELIEHFQALRDNLERVEEETLARLTHEIEASVTYAQETLQETNARIARMNDQCNEFESSCDTNRKLCLLRQFDKDINTRRPSLLPYECSLKWKFTRPEDLAVIAGTRPVPVNVTSVVLKPRGENGMDVKVMWTVQDRGAPATRFHVTLESDGHAPFKTAKSLGAAARDCQFFVITTHFQSARMKATVTPGNSAGFGESAEHRSEIIGDSWYGSR